MNAPELFAIEVIIEPRCSRADSKAFFISDKTNSLREPCGVAAEDTDECIRGNLMEFLGGPLDAGPVQLVTRAEPAHTEAVGNVGDGQRFEIVADHFDCVILHQQLGIV